MICSVEGCEQSGKMVKGWCNKHYKKWKKYGDPLAGHENRQKGAGTITINGYRKITVNGRAVFEHVLIIEKALGHEIPGGSVSHHIDGKRAHNENSNLVLCDSQSYHQLLEMRTRAYLACGHANWRKCRFCGQYDDPKGMYIGIEGNDSYHRECCRKYRQERSQNGRAETLSV